jgi:hypothetical protein
MKKLFIPVIALLFFCGSAAAQSKAEKQVAAAAESLRAAMVDPTKEKLEAIITDSLTYGHSGGHVDRKQEFIDKLLTGKSDFVSIDITNQTIQVYKNTAFVRHELTAVTNDNNKPGNVHLLVLLAFVKDHGNWKLAARQAVHPS